MRFAFGLHAKLILYNAHTPPNVLVSTKLSNEKRSANSVAESQRAEDKQAFSKHILLTISPSLLIAGQ
jgi:hypothetical protein